MCGSPAVPSISASPSDIASSGFETSRPGASTAAPYCSRGGPEQRKRAEAEPRQRHHREQKRAAQQQHGLDNLHPRRRHHAAEQHVREHHDADDGDGKFVFEAEEQPDEVARADHLRDQIERHDRERADGGSDADGRLPQPERDDIGKRVPSEIAQRLGDEKHHDRPPDEKSDRVDQPVEARQRDEARDAEEARGAHVVAGQREAVLQTRDAAAGGVEVIGAARAPRRDVGDAERQRDEDEKENARHDRPRSASIAAS